MPLPSAIGMKTPKKNSMWMLLTNGILLVVRHARVDWGNLEGLGDLEANRRGMVLFEKWLLNHLVRARFIPVPCGGYDEQGGRQSEKAPDRFQTQCHRK
jgi:hypothetical protein